MTKEGGKYMEYNFNYATVESLQTQGSIHLFNAPLLLDCDLLSIAQAMERNGRFHGQAFRIHSIGIQSDYLPPTVPMRMIHLDKRIKM